MTIAKGTVKQIKKLYNPNVGKKRKVKTSKPKRVCTLRIHY